MSLKKFYISSPNNGGLYLLEDKRLSLIESGNIRGLTYKDDILYFVSGCNVKTLQGETMPYLPKILWHDIRFYDNYFYLMSTEYKKLYQVDCSGKTIRFKKFEDCYWPNCCLKCFDGLIVFLSAKRPYSKSKIILLNDSWETIWEYNCFECDEIHSPFLVGNELYWCRSNSNSVVKASINKQLKNVSKVIVNYNGYTRGLFLIDDLLVLGTSENRHSKNSSCRSYIKNGCIHFYKGGKIVEKFILSHNEVYDIC